MAIDFSQHQSQSDIIPHGTIAPVRMTVRPGGVGDGGFLRQSMSSPAQMLDCEFTILDGPFARRKFWHMFVVAGSEKGAPIGMGQLSGIVDSIRNLKSSDRSPEANAKRQVDGWHAFDGVEFMAKIIVQPGKDGYQDSNRLGDALTPGNADYRHLNTAGPAPMAAAQVQQNAQAAYQQQTPQTEQRPAWAQ